MTHIRFRQLCALVLAACITSEMSVQAATDDSSEQAAPMTLQVQNVTPPLPDQMPDIDPIALYGGDIIFDVYRKGEGEFRAHAPHGKKQSCPFLPVSQNIKVDHICLKGGGQGKIGPKAHARNYAHQAPDDIDRLLN